MSVQDEIPRSRITLSYRTTINGQPEDVILPFRLLVVGDFSQGRSTKRKQPLEQREMYSLNGRNLNEVMANMQLQLFDRNEQSVTIPSMPAPGTFMISDDKIYAEAWGRSLVDKDDKPLVDGKGAPSPAGAISVKAQFIGSDEQPLPNFELEVMTAAPKPEDAGTYLKIKGATDLYYADKNKRPLKLGDDSLVEDDGTSKIDTNGKPKISVRMFFVDNEGNKILGKDQAPLIVGEPRQAVYFDGLNRLSPDGLAAQLPDIKRLLRVKTLLLEMQAALENRKDLREALDRVIASESMQTLQKKLHAKNLKFGPLAVLSSINGDGETATVTRLPLADPPGEMKQLQSDSTNKPPAIEEPLTLLANAVDPRHAVTDMPEFDIVNGALEQLTEPHHFLTRLGALALNVNTEGDKYFDKRRLTVALKKIDQLINEHTQAVMLNDKFKKLAETWLGLENLVQNTNFKANVKIDILDVSQDELREDFARNTDNFFTSAFFKRVYIEQYDQYGGVPFGAIIGLYEFKNTPGDLQWLRSMAKIANASHTPFISAAAPQFFGCEDAEQCSQLKDLPVILNQPQYQKWNEFRDTEEAAYVGLAFPRFLLRAPYHPKYNQNEALPTYDEMENAETLLWGNPAILLARNLIRSFITSGWCQYLRGPRGGGKITGLPEVRYEIHGQDALKPPVEIVIPDYRELEFARGGFIPLISKKDSPTATFFSVQSIKLPKRFKDPKDTENSQLVCNLAYTFSVTRIAHYVKTIMRDNIGTGADATYIQRVLDNWLKGYVTEVTNPDDLTMQTYPFKAAVVQVTNKPGQIGWYDCTISILPHIQFEGLNVELRVESRLGQAA